MGKKQAPALHQVGVAGSAKGSKATPSIVYVLLLSDHAMLNAVHNFSGFRVFICTTSRYPPALKAYKLLERYFNA